MNKLETLLKLMGFKIIHVAAKNSNGPDIVASKNRRSYSFEVKKAIIKKSKSVQCPPVEPNRKLDDYIVIIFPSGYILIEPMEQHLTNCTKSGSRSFNGIR